MNRSRLDLRVAFASLLFFVLRVDSADDSFVRLWNLHNFSLNSNADRQSAVSALKAAITTQPTPDALLVTEVDQETRSKFLPFLSKNEDVDGDGTVLPKPLLFIPSQKGILKDTGNICDQWPSNSLLNDSDRNLVGNSSITVVPPASDGGYFKALLGGKVIVLALNSVLYKDGTTSVNAAVYDHCNQLSWLKEELEALKTKAEKAVIVASSGPGFVLNDLGESPTWSMRSAAAYKGLMQRYYSYVSALLLDDPIPFRIFFDNRGSPISTAFGMMAGVGQSVRLYLVDPAVGRLVNVTQLTFNQASKLWSTAYQAPNDLEVEDLSPKTLLSLYVSFCSNETRLDRIIELTFGRQLCEANETKTLCRANFLCSIVVTSCDENEFSVCSNLIRREAAFGWNFQCPTPSNWIEFLIRLKTKPVPVFSDDDVRPKSKFPRPSIIIWNGVIGLSVSCALVLTVRMIYKHWPGRRDRRLATGLTGSGMASSLNEPSGGYNALI